MVLVSTATTVDGGDSRPHLSEEAAAWAKQARGLSRATLERLSVTSGSVFFPEPRQKLPALMFHYRGGHWKARSFPEKWFATSKGFKQSFWGEDEVLAGHQDRVWIDEGELDRCAMVEAGLPPDAVLSVPNGARERPAEDPKEMRGYDYVTAAMNAGLVRKGRKFVWAGDGDGPGRALRDDMARLFGAANFYFITWPEGCNDPNAMLQSDGGADLLELVRDGAQPWPVSGLYRLSELPEPVPMTLWQPGFPEWESKVMLAPGTLSVVTGHPGMGKSLLFTQIWWQVLERYGLVAAVASFETRPKPHMRRQLRTLITGNLEHMISDDGRARADRWIDDHYVFMSHPTGQPTLEWFLDLAEVAVVRHGARVVTLDPWNRLESARARGEQETDYILRCLRAVYAFAVDLNCHVQIIAHPAKMEGNRRGKPPDLEDISGSRHWENLVDQGFVVHRPKIWEDGKRQTEAKLYARKARFDELGYACSLDLNYKIEIGRYVSTDYDAGGYGAMT